MLKDVIEPTVARLSSGEAHALPELTRFHDFTSTQKGRALNDYSGGVAQHHMPDGSLEYCLHNIHNDITPSTANWSQWSCTIQPNTTDVQGIYSANSATSLLCAASTGTHVCYQDVSLIANQRIFLCGHIHEDSDVNEVQYHMRMVGSGSGNGGVTVSYNIHDAELPYGVTATGVVTLHSYGADQPDYLPDGWHRIWLILEIEHDSYATDVRIAEIGTRSVATTGVEKVYVDGCYAFHGVNTYAEADAILQEHFYSYGQSGQYAGPRIGCIYGDSEKGLIAERATTNMHQYTHMLDSWTANGTTITADQSAFLDGRTVMDEIAASASFKRIEQTITMTLGEYYAVGIFAKANTATVVNLNVSDVTGFVDFDLSNDTSSLDTASATDYIAHGVIDIDGSTKLCYAIIDDASVDGSNVVRWYPDKDSSTSRSVYLSRPFCYEGQRHVPLVQDSPGDGNWVSYTKAADNPQETPDASWFDEDEGFCIVRGKLLGEHDTRYIIEFAGSSSTNRIALKVDSGNEIDLRVITNNSENALASGVSPDKYETFTCGFAWSKSKGQAMLYATGGSVVTEDLNVAIEPPNSIESIAYGTRVYSYSFNMDGVINKVGWGKGYPTTSELKQLVDGLA